MEPEAETGAVVEDERMAASSRSIAAKQSSAACLRASESARRPFILDNCSRMAASVWLVWSAGESSEVEGGMAGASSNRSIDSWLAGLSGRPKVVMAETV